MERRYIRETKGPLTLQKKMAETLRREEPPPDLTDFMNDMFFGTADTHQKTYDLTGGVGVSMDDEEKDDGFDDSTRSNSARLTQEWLQEARRVVASSPSRSESPGRLLGSPRFASPSKSLLPSSDRTDALSRTRSARRYRTVEGISDEILSKTAKHTRNKSDTFSPQPSTHGDESPATVVHKWFSNILKPNNNNNNSTPPPSPDSLPPRQPFSRKSRFKTEPSAAPHPQAIQPPNHNSRRTFKTSAPSPENPNRRTTPTSDSLPLSPPRNLVESAYRRTISSSTCSSEKIAPAKRFEKEEEEAAEDYSLNGFLKEQRNLFQRFSRGELRANVKIKFVLSGPSNSTASMVAAICHAWLLGYRNRENDDGGKDRIVVVPVMNVKRGAMCNLKQAAWLFHHAALDATSLLFIDEVDMESLLVTGKLSVLVVGQDILNATNEVGSQCTVLTDNYCEDAYDLLQNSVLKKLLLAGILLDTQNLKASTSVSMTRDAEAVQLLLVGSAPNYRYALFDQLMQDQQSSSFVESLNHNYWKLPDESDQNSEGNIEHKVREGKSSSTSDRETTMPSSKTNSTDAKVKLATPVLQSPSPAASSNAEKEAGRGKNKFFLARWFGFGSK
ncbi:unnamed protein product [Vicia faba]|uniref:Uncharacterized protein n=1 Tax=Vicia faba TaxID=3906 RepID=A0AAV1AJT2_VICFA|nr:unnamed protein product [Vicia faba]